MQYTTIDLVSALRIRDVNSKRIYEMLCQFKDAGVFRIAVQELKERLGLVNLETKKETYPNFEDFDKKVLQVALKEINEQSDINFTYITTKTGDKVTDLEFRLNAAQK